MSQYYLDFFYYYWRQRTIYPLYIVVEASGIHYGSNTILQCILKQVGEEYNYSDFKTLS